MSKTEFNIFLVFCGLVLAFDVYALFWSGVL